MQFKEVKYTDGKPEVLREVSIHQEQADLFNAQFQNTGIKYEAVDAPPAAEEEKKEFVTPNLQTQDAPPFVAFKPEAEPIIQPELPQGEVKVEDAKPAEENQSTNTEENK